MQGRRSALPTRSEAVSLLGTGGGAALFAGRRGKTGARLVPRPVRLRHSASTPSRTCAALIVRVSPSSCSACRSGRPWGWLPRLPAERAPGHATCWLALDRHAPRRSEGSQLMPSGATRLISHERAVQPLQPVDVTGSFGKALIAPRLKRAHTEPPTPEPPPGPLPPPPPSPGPELVPPKIKDPPAPGRKDPVREPGRPSPPASAAHR